MGPDAVGLWSAPADAHAGLPQLEETGIGGPYPHAAAAVCRLPVLTALAEAHDELVDAVGGELGLVPGENTRCDVRVGAVDRGLVGLPAGPERERGGSIHERRADQAGIGGAQRLDQGG